MRALDRLETDIAGQKRLQNYFDDRRIRFGRLGPEMQVWYVPANSRPYKVCSAENVAHAQKQLIGRSYADKIHAKNLLAEIDAHNDKLLDTMREDAVAEVKADLNKIARGRQTFLAR